MTIERGQNTFSDNSDHSAMVGDKRLAIAKTIVAQVELLQYYGLDSDNVALAVSHMQSSLERVSGETLDQVRGHLAQAVRILTTDNPGATGHEGGAVISLVEELSHHQDEHRDELVEAEKVRQLPKPIMNAFYGVLAKPQLADLFDFDETQRAQLLELLADFERVGNQDRFREKHLRRLGQVFDGMTMRAISQAEATNYSSISETFSKALPRLVAAYEERFLQGFIAIREGNYVRTKAETAEESVPKQPPKKRRKSPRKIAAKSRIDNRSVECPDGVPREVNYLFVDILDFEQIAAIAQFTAAQKQALVACVDELYKGYAPRQTNRKWQMGRFEKLLAGVSAADIIAEEHSSPNALYESFRSSLPKLLHPHKDEVRQQFETIRAMNSDPQPIDEPVSIETSETKPVVAIKGDELSAQEQEVIDLRMGKLDGMRRTHEEIADELDISRSEVQRILSVATAKLTNSRLY